MSSARYGPKPAYLAPVRALDARAGRWYAPNTVKEESAQHPVKIVYTNYRHQTALRTIIPERVWFGSTEWHPEPQWLLEALDIEKGERRSFAMADIKCWFHGPVVDGEKP